MRQLVPKQKLYQSPGEFLANKPSNGSAATDLTVSSSTENNSPPASPTDSSQATPQNLETTISQLRKSLEETNERESAAQSALAKSDAVILELRSNVRQLKRQVEQVQKEKEYSDNALKSEQQQHKNQIKSQMQVSESHSKDQIVGELQVQLDRAHAQILTADMVRKELEDTLEAEQYTWELRVQDQERQIALLQQECLQLKDDLEECRSQWQEAEHGWSAEIASLKSQGNNRDDIIPERLRTLEKERAELQGCLDEAMKELEAVDQELRQNPNVLEPLQHLYQWVMQHNSEDIKEIPSDANALVERIQHIIESSPNNQAEITELETQISVYRGDLKAREESSAELRASLREAVALLKPLQDAVSKSEGERTELEAKFKSLQKERDMLKAEANLAIGDSQQEFSPRTMPSGEEQVERSAREKRDFARKKFEQMLSSASTRFEDLQKGSSSLVDENEELKLKINKLENQLKEMEETQMVRGGENSNRDAAFQMREAAIEQLEQDLEGYSQQLERKEEEFRNLQEELHQVRRISNDGTSDNVTSKLQVEKLERELEQKCNVERELATVKEELSNKSEAERMLNESLKEALSLLQPLQVHLETAEKEKKALAKELKRTRKTMTKLDKSIDSRSTSQSVDASVSQSDFDFMIDQLHQENPTKLQEELVEMKSRSLVTEKKLKEATLRNSELKDTLVEKEHSQQEMTEELAILRKKLEKSEHELENAKYIATSALMKVEELTMASISSDLLTGNKGNGSVVESPKVVEQLNQRVQSLKMEVDSAHELNESLEESIQERDRILDALAEQHGQSPSRSSISRYSQGNNQRHKGVTWG